MGLGVQLGLNVGKETCTDILGLSPSLRTRQEGGKEGHQEFLSKNWIQDQIYRNTPKCTF